ncbi:MAG: hypothetical protein DHS20C11_15300 [Lysobacteraceae bacterium]|nr:MAG: hypothetical protein DHS20C11_15300 [Xanthomonadaceae bacterium]
MTAAGKRLSKDDIHKLIELTERYAKSGVNVAWVDGLFAALVAAPTLIPPSAYLQEIRNDTPFVDEHDAITFMSLIQAHWNDVVSRFAQAYFRPLLVDHDSGGETWARGYLHGVKMTPFDWEALFKTEDGQQWLLPILTLAHLNDPDPELRPFDEPDLDRDERTGLHDGMAMAATMIFSHFGPLRVPGGTGPHRVKKTGRNEPCPCGSGKKYKRCCMAKLH